MPRQTGVIDTLSAGFEIVNGRPWIVLFPIVLDLFLWFSPRIPIASLVEQVLAQPDVQRGLGPNGARAVKSTDAMILQQAGELNLLALLAPSWIGVPAIAPLLEKGRAASTPISSWPMGLALGLAALSGGALLGSVYRGVIAQDVREETLKPTVIAKLALVAWIRLLGLMLVLVTSGVLLGLPVAFAIVGVSSLVRELGGLALAVLMTIALWAQLYLFFAADAILVGRVGPFEAIRRSVRVVRGNLWAAVRIAVLISVILLGMGQVWATLASQGALGPALGIVGNAYVASGLVAASMLFFRERVEAPVQGAVPIAGEA